MNEVLEELWNAAHVAFYDTSAIQHQRKIFSSWRKIFERHGLRPRRYLAVLHQGNGHFMVESRSRPGQMHAVEFEGDKFHCMCEDFTMNKNTNCEHIKHVQRLIDEDILPGHKS